jgi:hypothetical protein
VLVVVVVVVVVGGGVRRKFVPENIDMNFYEGLIYLK